MSLVSINDACTAMGLDASQLSTADTAKLQQAIDDVGVAVESHTARKFEATSQSDYIDGGLVSLALRGRPIIAVTALYDVLTDPVNPVDSSIYDLDPDTGLVYQSQATGLGVDTRFGRGLAWGHGRRRWRVDYSYGYAAVPNDVRRAVLDSVKALFTQGGANVTAERIGDYSYQKDTRGTDLLTAAALDALSRYMGRVNV